LASRVNIKARSGSPKSFGTSASEILKSQKRFTFSVEPLDKLINGGLPSGQLLELSGPPGSPREYLIISLICEATKSGEAVLYIGKQPSGNSIFGVHDLPVLGMQNTISPTYLGEHLGLCVICFITLISKQYCEGDLAQNVHFHNIYSLAELLALLRGLPSWLKENPKVVSFHYLYQLRA
jgi:hypothetical protein